MKTYIIGSLKWTITLVLAYAIYSTGHNYEAIALIWVMVWMEALGYVVGKYIVLCDLLLSATTLQGACVKEMVDTIQAVIDGMENK